jgi:hypothetical protein
VAAAKPVTGSGGDGCGPKSAGDTPVGSSVMWHQEGREVD